jgi:MraZ protein
MFSGFFGNYQHNLDDKGRLMIPSRYRDLLAGNNAFITQGFDKCLAVMTEEHFKQVYEQLETLNLTDPNARLLRRLILANAYPVEVDKVGRILVPQTLRAFLQIQGEAVIVGQGPYFEVWHPDDWKVQEDNMQDVEANNARLAALKITTKSSAS